MSKLDDFSETVHRNMSFNLTTSPFIKIDLDKEEQNQKPKKKIFEVFHKKMYLLRK